MGCQRIGVSGVAVTLCLSFQFLACLPAGGQGPAEAEIAAAVKVARQKVAEEFAVSQDEVRVVGEPVLLPDHARFHHRPAGEGKAAQVGPKKGRPLLVTLDAGLGAGVCGLPQVVVGSVEPRVFPELLLRPPFSDLPFTEEECQRVRLGVEQFIATGLDFKRGPERFLPLLAEKVDADELPSGKNWSGQEHHRMISIVLNTAFLGMLAGCEREYIQLPEATEEELKEESEMLTRIEEAEREGRLSVETFEAAWEASVTKYLLPLDIMGVLDEEHLAAVHPCAEHYTSLIGKFQADSNGYLRDRQGGALLYSVFWGRPGVFTFVWEAGRLKLSGLYTSE